MKGYKLCVLGYPGVGKTAMIKRYETGEFKTDYKLSIGMDFITKELEIEGEKVITTIWDFGGSTKFEKIAETIFKGMHGCLIVYDITNKKSFENITFWINQIVDNRDIISDKVIKILVGNKKDLSSLRKVEFWETREYWERSGIETFETSAKTGENIEEAFSALIKQVYKIHHY